MANLRFLLLTIITFYIFGPTVINWISADDGVWYRPFIVWLIIVIATFIFQKFYQKHDL